MQLYHNLFILFYKSFELLAPFLLVTIDILVHVSWCTHTKISLGEIYTHLYIHAGIYNVQLYKTVPHWVLKL